MALKPIKLLLDGEELHLVPSRELERWGGFLNGRRGAYELVTPENVAEIRRALMCRPSDTTKAVYEELRKQLEDGSALFFEAPPEERAFDTIPEIDIRDLLPDGADTDDDRPYRPDGGLHWVEIICVSPNDESFAGARARLRLPDGRSEYVTLDGGSSVRFEDLTEGGTVHFELSGDAVARGSLSLPGGTRYELGSSIGLTTRKQHVLVVHPNPRAFVSVELLVDGEPVTSGNYTLDTKLGEQSGPLDGEEARAEGFVLPSAANYGFEGVILPPLPEDDLLDAPDGSDSDEAPNTDEAPAPLGPDTIDPSAVPDATPISPDAAAAFVELAVINETGEPLVSGHAEIEQPGGSSIASEDISSEPLRRDLEDTPTHVAGRLSRLRWWGSPGPTPKPAPPQPSTKDPTIVSFEDLLFNMNSPVVLPSGRIDPQADDPHERITGLDVFRSIFEVCREHERHILIVGHTDTTGRREYNETLSLERAQNVAMVLEGEHESWADANAAKSYKVDYKLILRWVHEMFGWDCDPGAINELDSLRTRQAIAAFRIRFDAEHGARSWSEAHGREDWLAYAQLYDVALASSLELSARDLGALREQLKFVPEKTLGYGERWPKEKPGADEFASEANRRVELWLFEPDELAELGALDSEGALLYGEASPYRPSYLTITKKGAERGFEVIVIDPEGNPMPETQVRLFQGGAVFLETATDSIGRVWVVPPQEGEDVELEVVDHDVFVGVGGVDDGTNVTPEMETADEPDGFVC